MSTGTCQFFLGTHEPTWLARLGMPLLVSRRRLAARCKRQLPRAIGTWALDSGGFSELFMFGKWQTPAVQYVAEVRRWSREIGGMKWAAIQDWMCEPVMLKKTGLSVEEHQRRTVESYETLLAAAPEVPWLPVLQGWTHGDYLRHVDLYTDRGHDLRKLATVGLGSVCRRQHTFRAEHMIRELSADGLRLHGFGFKTLGLARVHDVLASADSLAWSFQARKNPPLPECRGVHASCANCIRYATLWALDLESKLDSARWSSEHQLSFGAFSRPEGCGA